MGNAARLTSPTGITVDSGGTLYVSEVKAGATGDIRRIAYTGGPNGDPSLNTSYTVSTPLATGLTGPTNLAIDTDGKIYVVSGTTVQVLARAAGGTYSAPSGFVTSLTGPQGVALDPAHNLYLTDNNQLKRYNPAGSGGVTIAGTGSASFVDGTSTATFSNPQGIGIEAGGTVLIADAGNHALRAVQRIVTN